MSEEKEGVTIESLAGACARFQEKLENCEDDLAFTDIWTESLNELSEIEKAFETEKLDGKTILDIGTYGVKPLYIALKYEPYKIIGIDEELSSCAKSIEMNYKLFVKTEIKFYPCNVFNDEKLNEILDKENQHKSDFVLLSKTLHHLRTGECIARKRDPEHTCQEDESTCIYKFDEQEIFNCLLGLGKRLIVYEWYDPGKSDNDKVRGRGGYFTPMEWERILRHLSEKYRTVLIQPSKFSINEEGIEKVIEKLRQIETICFYVEKVE